MKKKLTLWIAMLLIAALLAGCGPAADNESPSTVEPESSTEAISNDDVVYEDNTSSYYINEVYAEQIGRYHTALSEKWNEGQYLDNGMSEVLIAYYEGNPLDNVGFSFVDLDNDGNWELVIGAILDAETSPSIFEVWTLVDNQPFMLAQAHTRNRYASLYVEEDGMWYIANEGSNSAFNNGTYFMMLADGKLEVIQGILFNYEADAENPWFMTFDMDWDISNDTPIDEETANAILDSYRVHYTALEYIPFSFYKP